MRTVFKRDPTHFQREDVNTAIFIAVRARDTPIRRNDDIVTLFPGPGKRIVPAVPMEDPVTDP